jgi:hypothetical protein
MRPSSIGLVLLLLAIPLARVCAADIAAVADTNTDSASPNANLGSNGVLAVAVTRTGLVRFDSAQVNALAGGTATLKLKLILAKNPNNGIAIRLVTGPWNEKTVTHATLPPTVPEALDLKTVTQAEQGKLVTFDVTTAVNIWKALADTSVRSTLN